MSDIRVARRYAKALFDVALKANVVESVESDLESVAGQVENDPKFKDFLYGPEVGRSEKLRIMERLYADRVTALTMKAIRLLLVKRREKIIPEVRDAFVRLRREQGNVLYAEVASAEPLDNATRGRIIEKLGKATKKQVEAVFVEDRALIGGVKVSYGNYVLDGTVRGGLRRLRDRLKYELLKQA